MKTYTAIVTGLLLIAIGFIWYQIHQARILSDFRTAEHLRFQDAIEKARQTAAIYADSASELVIRQALYRDSARLAQGALRQRIALLMGKIRQHAQPTPHEDTICTRFIVAGLQKDTVIHDQRDLIAGFEAENINQDSTFASFRRFKDQEIAVKDTIIGTLQDDRDYIAEKLLKAEKKAKRKENWNKVWKVTSGVAAGVAAVFILK